MCVKITFDPDKDAINIAKHGVSMALASELDWESAQLWLDTRKEYGEMRIIALALMKTRLFYHCCPVKGIKALKLQKKQIPCLR